MYVVLTYFWMFVYDYWSRVIWSWYVSLVGLIFVYIDQKNTNLNVKWMH